jgi:aminomethyltransferase
LRAVADADLDGLKYFRVTSGSIRGCAVDISRTGYTGDLGYELWIRREDAGAVWDALADAGPAFGLRPAGMLALDVARIEAGLLLIDVDFFSVRKALTSSQVYSPLEMGLDRLVSLEKASFIGREALVREAERGPSRRIVGIEVSWPDVERLYEAVGLPPLAEATASRSAVPVYAGGRQVGRMTSSTWSPVLKKMIGLARSTRALPRPDPRWTSNIPSTPSATGSARGSRLFRSSIRNGRPARRRRDGRWTTPSTPTAGCRQP